MFTLGNKLNRLYSLAVPFNESTCEITIAFNKSNSFLGFNIDQKNYIKSRNNEIKCSIYSDLMQSEFATSFLDIRNFKSLNLDIKRQFHNIINEYKNKIHYETNETIKLSKVSTPKGPIESCLYIYVFRYTDFDDDFVYCLAERQHIDVVLEKKIVRTAAIQICTNDCFEDLAKIIETSNRHYVNKQVRVDDAFDDVFTEKKTYNKK